MELSNQLIRAAKHLAPAVRAGTAVVYFLRLKSGMIYIGCSVDLEQRLRDHQSGQACRTTALDPPTALLRVEVCPTFSDARRREAQLKRWSRPKKEAHIRGDFDRLRKLSRSRDQRIGGAPGVSAKC
ncbi:MAG: GIY-YIG nuclease family protein [Lacunisphaera sp.]|nr:GIY-YIG nuclease family protein [Lacunisphaera sp.]